MPAYTYVASATAVLQNNLVPVFVDVDPDTYNIDPTRLEEAIGPRTRAVMPVHFGGQIADMDAVGETARRHRRHLDLGPADLRRGTERRVTLRRLPGRVDQVDLQPAARRVAQQIAEHGAHGVRGRGRPALPQQAPRRLGLRGVRERAEAAAPVAVAKAELGEGHGRAGDGAGVAGFAGELAAELERVAAFTRSFTA